MMVWSRVLPAEEPNERIVDSTVDYFKDRRIWDDDDTVLIWGKAFIWPRTSCNQIWARISTPDELKDWVNIYA